MNTRVAQKASRAGQEEVLFHLPLAPPKATQGKVGKKNNRFAGSLFTKYLQLPIQESVNMVRSKPDSFWMREGQKRALCLFREVAQRVPAYRDFLKKNKVVPSKICTIKDFQTLPWVDRKNYLEKYPLDALSWDGVLDTNNVISVSSGSSGKPFFWPRGSLLDIEATLCHEMFFQDVFECGEYQTLFVNSFAMGMYIAGPLTYSAAMRNSQKGYPMTVIAPGLEVRDALQAIHDLYSYHDQIILAGYPPFIKDIVDEGRSAGISWRKKGSGFFWLVRVLTSRGGSMLRSL